MNARALALLCCVAFAGAAAAQPAFDEKQSRELQAVIQAAVADALRHPSVGDGNARSVPPATVVWSRQAPELSEAQRVELARMVDGAVRRLLSGETDLATLMAGSGSGPAPAAEAAQSIDPSLPTTDLTLEAFERLAREQGFDAAGAWDELEPGPGAVSTAIALTDVGLNSAPTTPASSNLQIVANGEGSRASLKIDRSHGGGTPQGGSVYWSRSLVFSAPVDKNDDIGTTLIGLDGLTNNFELAYNVSRLRTEPLGRRSGAARSLLFEMPRACRDLGIAMEECDLSVLLRVAQDKAGNPEPSVAQRARDIASTFALTGRTWVQGFRLKAGYDDFEFFDPATLAKRSQDEVPWNAGVFAGVLSGTSYYTAGLDYQRAYKAGTAGVACPAAVPDAPVTHCVDGALDAPSSKEKHLLTLEGRWLLGSRAVGARLVHDFKNDHWGVDVPVYLFPNDKGLLSGGLKFGWSDVDQFSAGIFAGVPFELLP